jgi:hypothetical protein
MLKSLRREEKKTSTKFYLTICSKSSKTQQKQRLQIVTCNRLLGRNENGCFFFVFYQKKRKRNSSVHTTFMVHPMLTIFFLKKYCLN